MGNLGIVTGRVIGKNRDGDSDRVLLQVEILDEDVRTIELISQAGEDVNPGNGCRVYYETVEDDGYLIAVAITDDLTPSVNPGERMIYSTDSPVTQILQFIKWAAGALELNGNADFAVRFNALKTEFDKFKSDYNGHKHLYFPGPLPQASSAVADLQTTADITTAKVDTVKLP